MDEKSPCDVQQIKISNLGASIVISKYFIFYGSMWHIVVWAMDFNRGIWM